MSAAFDVVRAAAEVLRPPMRIDVVDAAQQFMRIHRPGGYSGPWSLEQTPYMAGPMNRLTDRSVEAVVFVGPARTGKSAALVLGWLTYIVMCDPGDAAIIHMTADTARDFSRDDLDRLHRHSPELQQRLSPYFRDDNVFDKRYRHGMILKIGWPAISQLSGKTLRYVALTDYDRYPDNIDGEGDGFTLARKRTQTYMTGGRILVESSPGRLLAASESWTPSSPHEGPPVGGVFALYNQGDRQRYYWPCPHCGEYFTPAASVDALTRVDEMICVICTGCGAAIAREHKAMMNRRGVWLAEGQRIAADGTVSGEARRSSIASYWLSGPQAAYQNWESLWTKHQAASEVADKTGNEDALQAVTTGDFGMAYRPRAAGRSRNPQALASRVEVLEKRHVPPEVRYLIVAVDVQRTHFVVQVIGYGAANERWLIDRYNLRWKAGQEAIDPARNVEDWRFMLEKVMRPYPLLDDPAYGLIPTAVAVDSGGRAGVTERAYSFWRMCRNAGVGRKVFLVKGGSRSDAPRVRQSFPDSSARRDRKANARGEIPVYLLNTLILKDALAADLDRDAPGPGYIHFPEWLESWFFEELTAEVRTASGWERPGHAHNEAFDLFCYAAAVNIQLGAERVDWTRPPDWACPETTRVAIADAPSATEKPAAPVKKSPVQRQGSGFIRRQPGEPWLRGR
jgi:phage terminase large subunit GpA-like protein